MKDFTVTFDPKTDINETELYFMWASLGLDIAYSAWLKSCGLMHYGCIYTINGHYMFRLKSTEDRLIFKLKYGI